MTRERLDEDEIDEVLDTLPGWTYDGTRLVRTITLESFSDAITYVNAVARVAEDLDHHPDIDIRYRDVTLRCWTHTTGCVTDSDVELARRC